MPLLLLEVTIITEREALAWQELLRAMCWSFPCSLSWDLHGTTAAPRLQGVTGVRCLLESTELAPLQADRARTQTQAGRHQVLLWR